MWLCPLPWCSLFLLVLFSWCNVRRETYVLCAKYPILNKQIQCILSPLHSCKISLILVMLEPSKMYFIYFDRILCSGQFTIVCFLKGEKKNQQEITLLVIWEAWKGRIIMVIVISYIVLFCILPWHILIRVHYMNITLWFEWLPSARDNRWVVY